MAMEAPLIRLIKLRGLGVFVSWIAENTLLSFMARWKMTPIFAAVAMVALQAVLFNFIHLCFLVAS